MADGQTVRFENTKRSMWGPRAMAQPLAQSIRVIHGKGPLDSLTLTACSPSYPSSPHT